MRMCNRLRPAGRNPSFLILLLCGLFSLTPGRADPPPAPRPFLHPLFSDGAVLQRGVTVPVWGWAAPGERVTVAFAGQQKTAVAAADGKWVVRLDALPASAEARTLVVSGSGAEHARQVADVLVGDVWLCSGQSNMEMGIGACNVPDEIAAADFPQIRLLTVPKAVRFERQDVADVRWSACNPQTVAAGGWGGFSAAGYFFGRELHQQLQIPIGLIHSSWGGTICEAWASATGLASLPDFTDRLAQVADIAAAMREGRPADSGREAWYAAHDPGTAAGWYKSEVDEAGWTESEQPREWQQAGLPDFDGIAWHRRSFEAPADWAGRDLVLELGPVDDADTTYFNGTRVGAQDDWQSARIYRVPGRLVKAGRNVIAVRVLDTASLGGLCGQPAQLRVYPVGQPAGAVALAGPWKLRASRPLGELASRPPGLENNNPNTSTVLFNGMIAPLLPFAIKGAIWYQGESNAGRGRQYRALLPAMIADWRAHFGVGDFPFYIVSLAAFMPPSAQPVECEWAELREAQALTARNIPNCGLAVAIDIGDAQDIHPKNKRDVGRRLALAALAQTYGQPVEGSGPWYRAMTVEAGRAVLQFDHAAGLTAKGGPLTGFAVAGADRKFVWADAVIAGETVVVSSPAVAEPVAVRYAWHANPVCNLYNGAGLPAVPFRTDDWPGLTDGKK